MTNYYAKKILEQSRNNPIPNSFASTRLPDNYWHGFVLANGLPDSMLTATYNNTNYNLIGIIHDGTNIHYGFINNPNPKYNCTDQMMYNEIKDRSEEYDKKYSKSSAPTDELVNIFINKFLQEMFLQFFYNKNSDLNYKYDRLKTFISFIINTTITELPQRTDKFYDYARIANEIIKKTKQSILKKFLLPSNSSVNTWKSDLFYVLNAFVKQHPFTNCYLNPEVINPNLIYTRNIQSLNKYYSDDINENNVNDFLTKLLNYLNEPESSSPSSSNSQKANPTYKITLSDKTSPLFLSTDIQKDGVIVNASLCIIAIGVDHISEIIDDTGSIDKVKLAGVIKTPHVNNARSWAFVSSIEPIKTQVVESSTGGADSQFGGNFITNTFSRKNKTLRSLKNAKRLELWG